jgi:cyclopropane-fatty-acyl-phospholipid synthase
MWRLYLVGAALAFEENRMGVDQILLVRPTTTGRSGMPATRGSFEPAAGSGVPDAASADTPTV